MRQWRARLFAVLLLVVAALPPRELAAQQPSSPASAASELTVYLMTFGPGAQVWERFGHNALWIHDPVAGTDEAYNYGLFDFAQENFVLRFVRGQMWYWMAGFPADRYVEQYRRDNRSVWIQELELTPAAAQELQRFLQWNAEPEHRFYHYDYYRDNCSTRVRDALDRVVKGALRTQTEDVPTGTTYRFHTQRLTANDPPIFTGLLLALGDRVDEPISAWDEMFLPLEMREHVRRVTVVGPDGARRPLVRSERTLFESTAPPPPARPPDWTLWYLLAGAMIGLVAVVLSRLARSSIVAKLGFAVVSGGWMVLAGLAGVVLAGLWGLTDHVMAARNENLLQVNPLALLVVPGVWRWRDRGRRARLAAAAAAGVAALSVAGLGLKLLPGFDQVNGPIIALALPAQVGIALALRRLTARRKWTPDGAA
ncbi:MAG TPA: DUF4105 domain-containing protein [Gemmatimonadales bacterium]|nr:DUF4105 domain-containing protein [Gemmatimonadales bacterium]